MRKRTDIDRLHDEIQELVDDLWHVPRFAGGRRGFRPHVDCIRSDDPPALHVIVELPGVDPASIKVVAADRVLVVAGERRRPQLSGRYQPAGDRVRPLPAPHLARRSPSTPSGDRALRAGPARSSSCRSPPQPPKPRARRDRDPRPRVSELTFDEPIEPRRRRDPGDAAGAAAEGDGRLPAVDVAARDRPGALDQARRRRRSRATGCSRSSPSRTRRPSSPAGTTSTRSARPRSSTR